MLARRILVSIAVAIGALIGAAPAQATFHLIKVREVYAGGSENTSYVELQMYASGQNFLATHSMTLYDSSGALVHTSTFTSGVANGANQATVLIGDTGASAAFGIAPDLVDEGLNISPAGGAACWNAGGLPADCVAWGSFNGGAALQTATGTTVGTPVSATGITTGKAIRRKITPNCSTLLEDGDDTNNSATDFEEASPSPRDNASPIVETPCTAPTTTIDTRPANPTNAASASFTYHSTPAGATFECSLEPAGNAPIFTTCPAGGQSYPGPLSETTYTFEVRAHNANGTGPAATYSWTVDTTPPIITITNQPADPGPGNSAAFAYTSNEAGSTSFECSLEPAGGPPAFTGCPLSGKTYPDAEHPGPLANGEWTFEVRAKDKAGNLSAPEPFPNGSFSWEVDNSLADTTPPDTTITSRPPDPSETPVATFTYASNEVGSTFECRLDAAAFASCPASGITYFGLANGSHTFQVRATDASANADPTPAGYSFDVVAPAVPPLPPPVVPPTAQMPPDTQVFAKPPARTSDRTATFRFRSTVKGARFQCAVDHSSFRACRSPFTTRPLAPGPHTIRIRAIAVGMIDLTPAVVRFHIVRMRGTR